MFFLRKEQPIDLNGMTADQSGRKSNVIWTNQPYNTIIGSNTRGRRHWQHRARKSVIPGEGIKQKARCCCVCTMEGRCTTSGRTVSCVMWCNAMCTCIVCLQWAKLRTMAQAERNQFNSCQYGISVGLYDWNKCVFTMKSRLHPYIGL